MAQRTLDRDLAELGYRRDGHTRGKGHPIYRHPDAGVVVAAGSPGDHRSDANTLSEARKRLRAVQSTGGAFVDYLCRTYKVPRDGELEVEFVAKEEVDRWRASGAAEGISRGTSATPILQRAKETERFELVHNRRGRGLSVWRVRGRDYVPGGVDADMAEPATPAAPEPSAPVNGHKQTDGVQSISALRDVMPELERWISAGVLADLAERDERIVVVLALVDQVLERYRRLRDEYDETIRQLEEMRAILDGSTNPQPARLATETDTESLASRGGW